MDGSAHVAGPKLPFGSAIDLAIAASQSGRRCESQHFLTTDGRRVPIAVIQ